MGATIETAYYVTATAMFPRIMAEAAGGNAGPVERPAVPPDRDRHVRRA